MENSVILYTVILMLRKINYYSFYKLNNVFFAMPCVSLVTDQSKLEHWCTATACNDMRVKLVTV